MPGNRRRNSYALVVFIKNEIGTLKTSNLGLDSLEYKVWNLSLAAFSNKTTRYEMPPASELFVKSNSLGEMASTFSLNDEANPKLLRFHLLWEQASH